ncbi:ABC transporter ATP-binding protein [Fretibacterium fastidiosum]|uniref:ABC-type multidrug transport system, ATPase and permease components n=1 Tax=Fretibacterium fastidiosum TaxID=651822 RepID=A0AB94IYC9_9BACT|nr:ABC transporter ATP-binding protein [Fretibacterium fastidiosum]CBL28727.1 ABC-type multidrug transport system, ATPase and permease components [Fretibacterium fastidiosum]
MKDSLFRTVTIGHPEKLRKSVFYTIVSYLVNVVPFGISIEVARTVFTAWSAGGAPDMAKLWGLSAFLLVWMLVMFAAEVPAYRACYWDAYEASAQGRAELAEKLRRLPLGYFARRDPGDLVNMIMGDFLLLETAISHQVPQMVGGLVLPAIAFVGLCFWNPLMAVAMFVSLPAAALVLALSTRLQNRLSQKHMRAKIDAGNRIQEYMNGIRVIKAYNLTGGRFARLESAFRSFMKESIRIEAAMGPFAMLAISMIRLGLTLMIVLGVHLMIGGTLDPVTFVGFLIVGTRVYDPLTAALLNFFVFRYSTLAGRRILSLMEEPEMTGGGDAPDRHDIELKNVTFGYGDEPVLRDVSLTFPQGRLTALVGPSGCGKTTLMKVMARFYDPQSGTVLFGGADEHGLDPEKLMRRISFVFQDVYLFRDTVRNNIAFGREGATEAEVEEAAKRACAHDFILRLPQGYDTMVGEGGSTLSGGEKQRISIARALLKDAPVVLLDEATASLDPENEVEVQRAVNALVEGRTVVVIAHKLRTVENADNIVVMEAGRVVDQGRHAELLERGGLYARLWTLQNESVGWSLTGD